MPNKTESYKLRPLGWEKDADEERIHTTSLDYLAAMTYNSYAIYFRLEDSERPKVVEALKAGLERTLSQCRHLVGRLEKNDDDDDHSFVKRKDDTVDFLVEYWDDAPDVPSFDELEQVHFATKNLGDTVRFSTPGMEYGEKPECHPDRKPVLSAFKANFIRGGLLFVMNHHHYCQDIMGWVWSARQLAGNCAAAMNGTAPPPWDPAAITDGKRFTANLASAQKVDGPKPPERHPDLKPASSVLFHLPRSKAEELKKLAMPTDPSKQWISTYDAFTALLWRLVTKHRRGLYGSRDEDAPLLAEAINFRLAGRLSPPVAEKYQRNLFFAAASASLPEQLTTAQVAETAPLYELAAKIRTMTQSMTQPALEATLAQLAVVRDKTCLFTRVNSFPPLTIVTTDWREAELDSYDFGFGRPRAYRHLFPVVTENLLLIFPRRAAGPLGEDEGPEFALSLENEILDAFLKDPKFKKYFEFRGFELETK
ncbi:hypothetical protein MCOR27_010363 [Pyricularia oryzae]|uniref:Acyltransferase n=2 Tax=Pyricularia TaxID=48558 RepID=A0ABQ8NJE6_PYRGI|nr:hypothetical protein MCOR01_002880 [Pyricularia oryzae]KAI6297514.1 hypothetical protein MCOR33_006167 [Pyricularia grisea]KAH9432865.1 hypothetical protein MCOR02_007539 [Pyricularia oryzae]KAI6259098.1 hypothetical protein MCOR19_004572 [Pyricularia oryzae]KAI6267963.1 hypothetical protein MCOR27_010363 [Pyricularia oryzae]